jgi:hypothetical protein
MPPYARTANTMRGGSATVPAAARPRHHAERTHCRPPCLVRRGDSARSTRCAGAPRLRHTARHDRGHANASRRSMRTLHGVAAGRNAAIIVHQDTPLHPCEDVTAATAQSTTGAAVLEQ